MELTEVRRSSQKPDGDNRGQKEFAEATRRSHMSEKAHRSSVELTEVRWSPQVPAVLTEVRRRSQRSDGAHRGLTKLTEIRGS